MICETKSEGAAVSSTARTEGVGRAAASVAARGPSERRNVGLAVGRAVMPAWDALWVVNSVRSIGI